MPKHLKVSHTGSIRTPKVQYISQSCEFDLLKINTYHNHFLYRFLPEIYQKKREQIDFLAHKLSHLDVLKENNKPVVLFHATLNHFEHFLPLSFFGTITAAKNVAFEKVFTEEMSEADLKTYQKVKEKKQENPVEWFRLTKMQQVNITPVCLNIRNPLYVADPKMHNLHNYSQMVLNEIEKDSYTAAMKAEYPILQKFAIAGVLMNHELNAYPPEWVMIFNEPHHMPIEKVVAELKTDTLFSPMEPFIGNDPRVADNQKENRKRLILNRMIHFYEKRGYDGLAFHNQTDDNGSLTYIAFRPEQVIRLDRKLPKNLVLSASKKRKMKNAVLEAQALNATLPKEFSPICHMFRNNYQIRVFRDIPPKFISQDNRLINLAKLFHLQWEKVIFR